MTAISVINFIGHKRKAKKGTRGYKISRGTGSKILSGAGLIGFDQDMGTLAVLSDDAAQLVDTAMLQSDFGKAKVRFLKASHAARWLPQARQTAMRYEVDANGKVRFVFTPKVRDDDDA